MSAKNYLSKYAKSFNWAGFFLPKKTYKKCSALYDFCRVADNIADDANTIIVKKEEFKKSFLKFSNLIILSSNFPGSSAILSASLQKS